MDLGLRDQVVLITGASGGIGRALALAFAEQGAQLVLHGHAGLDGLERWVAQQTWRDRATCVGADVRDAEAMVAAVDHGVATFGRVDACIANAGRWTPPDRPLHQCSPERVAEAVSINLLGTAWTARAWLRALARTGPRPDGRGACLVMIGSTAGRFGEAGHAEYAAAKAGLYGLLYSLKNEIVALDPYGRVNLLEPGWTVTHMVREALERPGAIAAAVRTMPLQQLARATDIAYTALYLASPVLARHVTGQVITVAGGMEGRVQWDPHDVDEDAVRRRLARVD